jgi:hypothetical protein
MAVAILPRTVRIQERCKQFEKTRYSTKNIVRSL